MAAFPITNPRYGFTVTRKPKMNIISFGDGFTQRLTKGLNQNPVTLNLKFTLSQTQSTTAITFLNERIEDGESFTFTIPNESVTKNFICQKYSTGIPFLNRVDLNCVFEEVFEP
tara:strand:+ start:704 stop:1045 length:342 start_codon:yes stop_codon:yes gene_type:complete